MKLLFSSTAAGGRSGWRSWPWAGRVVRGENSEHLWGGSDRWWPKFSAGRREEIFYVRDYFRWVSRDAILILWFPPEHHVTKQFCHLVPHAPESYTLNSVGLTPDWILLVWRQMTPGFSQHPRGDNFPALTYLLCYNDSVFFKTVSVFRTLKTCFRSHLLLTVVTSISIENTEEKYKEDYLWIYCCIKPIHNQLAWIGRWSSQVKTDS